jgi:2,3-bisphosphoglycerate-independent phosphoglycerate mutase
MTLGRLELLQSLAQPGGKMLFIVLDGVGDLPIDSRTALERAVTPNLDRLAAAANLGLIDPVDRGITPGSGLGHLSLFGYDVYEHLCERGVLEALGVGLEVGPDTVAVRGNFVTLAGDGTIADRRAGRIGSDEGGRIVEKMAAAIREIDGVGIELRLIKEYRFSLVLHGAGLGGAVDDTDPQKTGLHPLPAQPRDEQSRRTAALLDQFAARAAAVLADESKANGVTLRGIGKRPAIPGFPDLYGIRGVAIANYPMYRGVGRLLGMDAVAVQGEGEALAEKIAAVEAAWPSYDFVFLHVKKTDSYGEDGNQDGKVSIIEAFDAVLPRLRALEPAVIAITGDHSTPASMRSHSWHPVPLLVHGPHMRACPAQRFTETAALAGALGRSRGMDIMPEVLAQAGRLRKFGA